MRKLLFVLSLCLMSGCSIVNNEKSMDTSMISTERTEKQEEKELVTEHMANFPVDIQDNQFAYDGCLEAALIHIESVDGFENYSSVHQAYIKTYTVGKATIKKSYKGVLSEGTMIDFYRMGGKIPFDDYYKARPKREQARLDQIEEKPEYVLDYYFGHTEVEKGKDYLAYLVKDKNIHNQGAYSIVCYDTGFREIRNNAIGEIQVLNNYTNTWESLGDVIPQ